MRLGDPRFRVDLSDDIVSSEDAPFVVVCGWFGARDKHVRKYTDELKRLRCGTMRTIMPDALVFSPFNAGREAYARDLLNSVRKQRRDRGLTGPLYFMFMSNGGCWLHAAMASTLMLSPHGEFSDLDEAITNGGGIIFDSAPAFMTITSGAQVLTLGMSLVPRVLVTVMFYVAAFAMSMGSLFSTGSLDAVPPRVFWKSVMEARGRRELYLYSDSDQLCNADKVAQLVKERRRVKDNCQITEVRWSQSRHCTHLIDKRDEYVAALIKFLNVKAPARGE